MAEPVLELRHLRMVLAIVEEGSITRAAERMHLTQSAVSHALRELERRLGTDLFHRNGRELLPTPAGERVIALARRTVGEVDLLEEELGAVRSGRTGVLRVSTQCYTSYHWLARVLPEFQREFEGVAIEIHPEATPQPLDLLLRGRIQLALVTRPPRNANIATFPLFRDEMVLVVPNGHALAGRDDIRPRELADQHVFVHVAPEKSFIMSAFLAPAGVEPARITHLSMTEALFEAVRAGLGVGVISRWMASPELDSDRLACASLADGVGRQEWHAAALRRDGRSGPLGFLIERLREAGPQDG